ncbi:alpha/beta fold hydrolase [Pseudoduganella sp. OTU4001]|uniref:alpha/beta fold hydrolase n=1 Tax=Pseudoduganella sp. OTU4001 TaxID=3043854 RepID=UPI00313E54B0
MKCMYVNGIAMNVLDEGSGPPLLLLHGFPDCHDVWRKQVPVLVAAGYRAIAPDLRGCGDSALLPAVGDYAMPHLLADLTALLDALALPAVQVVAHDWGAVIGWQLAMAHPERVQRLVAMSVGHPRAYAGGGLAQIAKGYYVGVFQLRGVAEWLLRAAGWAGFRILAGHAAEAPHWIERLARPGRLAAAINYYRANLHLLWRRDYPALTMPVVGIYSDGDRFLTRRQMLASARYCMVGFRYLEVPGVGHWMQLEAPGVINAMLLDILKENLNENLPA